jgi:hypothetical protein
MQASPWQPRASEPPTEANSTKPRGASGNTQKVVEFIFREEEKERKQHNNLRRK